jgi:hypothetical protein
MFCLFALSASAGLVQAKIPPQPISALNLAQVQAFLDHAAFSVVTVCGPGDCILLKDFAAPSEVHPRCSHTRALF